MTLKSDPFEKPSFNRTPHTETHRLGSGIYLPPGYRQRQLPTGEYRDPSTPDDPAQENETSQPPLTPEEIYHSRHLLTGLAQGFNSKESIAAVPNQVVNRTRTVYGLIDEEVSRRMVKELAENPRMGRSELNQVIQQTIAEGQDSPLTIVRKGAEAITQSMKEYLRGKSEGGLYLTEQYLPAYEEFIRQLIYTGKIKDWPGVSGGMVNIGMGILTLSRPKDVLTHLQQNESWPWRIESDPELMHGERTSFPIGIATRNLYHKLTELLPPQVKATRTVESDEDTLEAVSLDQIDLQNSVWLLSLLEQWTTAKDTFRFSQYASSVNVLYYFEQPGQKLVPIQLKFDLANLPNEATLARAFKDIRERDFVGEDVGLSLAERVHVRGITFQPIPLDQKPDYYRDLAESADIILSNRFGSEDDYYTSIEHPTDVFTNLNHAVYHLNLGYDHRVGEAQTANPVKRTILKTLHRASDGVASRDLLCDLHAAAERRMAKIVAGQTALELEASVPYQTIQVFTGANLPTNLEAATELASLIPEEIIVTSQIDAATSQRLERKVEQFYAQPTQVSDKELKLDTTRVKTSLNRLLGLGWLLATDSDNASLHFLVNGDKGLDMALAGLPLHDPYLKHVYDRYQEVVKYPWPGDQMPDQIRANVIDWLAHTQPPEDAASLQRLRQQILVGSVLFDTDLQRAKHNQSLIATLSTPTRVGEFEDSMRFLANVLLGKPGDWLGQRYENLPANHLLAGAMTSVISHNPKEMEQLVTKAAAEFPTAARDLLNGKLAGSAEVIDDWLDQPFEIEYFASANPDTYNRNSIGDAQDGYRHGGVNGVTVRHDYRVDPANDLVSQEKTINLSARFTYSQLHGAMYDQLQSEMPLSAQELWSVVQALDKRGADHEGFNQFMSQIASKCGYQPNDFVLKLFQVADMAAQQMLDEQVVATEFLLDIHTSAIRPVN